jgi:transposase
MEYSRQFKDRMVEKMLSSEHVSATALSREVGVPQSTLSRWLREKRQRGNVNDKGVPSQGSRRRKERPAAEKIRLVMEAAALGEAELGAFLRKEGLHEADLESLRQEVVEAAADGLEAKKKRGPSPAEKELKEVRRELARKEKALAEAAALLVLRGKLEAFLSGDEEGDMDGKKGK